MAKELQPRIHPVPEHLEPYLLQVDIAALENMEDEVYRLVMLDVSPKAIAEQIEEDGWDREFVTWLANFTQAQRRPIRAVIEEEFERQRFLALRQEEDRRFDAGTWLCGVGMLVCGTCTLLLLVQWAAILWPVAIISLFIAGGSGIRFLVGLIERVGRKYRFPG